LTPATAWAGAQREETLADDVASVMRSSINSASPARLVFADSREGERWLAAMSSRLARFIPDEGERRRLLVNIQYESSRAGLNTQVILGLIEVESAFRQYAISGVGARGLMQVMPFWKNISKHNKLNIQFKKQTIRSLGRLKTKQECLHVLLPNLRRGFQIPVVIESTNPLRLERDKNGC